MDGGRRSQWHGLHGRAKVKYLLVLLLILTAGCRCPPLGHRYTLMVDPTFSPDEQEAFLAAADSWTKSVSVTLNVQVGVCGTVTDGMICSHHTDRAGIPTGNGIGPSTLACTHQEHDSFIDIDGGDMYFDVPFLMSWAPHDNQTYLYEFQHAIAHEMGHAMGLIHHDPPSGELYLMGTYSNQDSLGPVDNDIEQWKSLR